MTINNFASNLGNPENFENEIMNFAANFFPELTPSSAYKPTLSQSEYVGATPIDKIRADFPILSEKINGAPLIWLDNAATTQRPRQVVNRIKNYYERENSNAHRSAHTLAARSTDAYELARKKIAHFIGAKNPQNIIFVRGTTEGLNLIAQSYVKPTLEPGDEIILTILEHHANIVPWQMIAEETGAVLRAAPVDETGQIILSEYERLFNNKTKFVSFAHVSNALGTIAPAAEMIEIAHRRGVKICVDGAQSVSHMPVDVGTLDADFFVFSGHKLFGPNGIGAVFGKEELLNAAKPYHGGGNMISDVTFERTVYQKAPQKFEAGTPNIAGAVGLGAAIDYLTSIGMKNIEYYERRLIKYATESLSQIPGVHLIGKSQTGSLSLILDGCDVFSAGEYLDEFGIAARAGHHCAQPILRRFGVEATLRPSFAFYNTFEEIDALTKALIKIS
jgi:cysteine desulfurase/selenocysteine lyase